MDPQLKPSEQDGRRAMNAAAVLRISVALAILLSWLVIDGLRFEATGSIVVFVLSLAIAGWGFFGAFFMILYEMSQIFGPQKKRSLLLVRTGWVLILLGHLVLLFNHR